MLRHQRSSDFCQRRQTSQPCAFSIFVQARLGQKGGAMPHMRELKAGLDASWSDSRCRCPPYPHPSPPLANLARTAFAGSGPGCLGADQRCARASVELRRRNKTTSPGAGPWSGRPQPPLGCSLGRHQRYCPAFRRRAPAPYSRKRRVVGANPGALLAARAPAEDAIPAGRPHATYDPTMACFTDLELTGAARADGGEGFGRFSFSNGDSL
jgi:hypothetical protein